MQDSSSCSTSTLGIVSVFIKSFYFCIMESICGFNLQLADEQGNTSIFQGTHN